MWPHTTRCVLILLDVSSYYYIYMLSHSERWTISTRAIKPNHHRTKKALAPRAVRLRALGEGPARAGGVRGASGEGKGTFIYSFIRKRINKSAPLSRPCWIPQRKLGGVQQGRERGAGWRGQGQVVKGRALLFVSFFHSLLVHVLWARWYNVCCLTSL